MMYFGIDVHSRFHQVCSIDSVTQATESFRFENSESGREALCALLAKQPSHVTMEACGGARKLSNDVRAYAQQVLVADPRSFRQRFPKKGRKTDKIDAYHLAKYGSEGQKGIWVPDAKTVERRTLSQHWRTLNKSMTIQKNTVHAHLREHHISHSHLNSLWTKKGTAWLESILPRFSLLVAMAIRHALETIKVLALQKREIEEAMAADCEQDAEMKLICTHPGLGTVSAYILMAEIGTISRFARAKSLIAYAGTAPGVSQSGDRNAKTSWITRQGRPMLRWIAIECALPSTKGCADLRNLYNRIVRRTKIKGKARVAVANKILIHIWHMLTKGEAYNAVDVTKLAAKEAIRQKKAARHLERVGQVPEHVQDQMASEGGVRKSRRGKHADLGS